MPTLQAETQYGDFEGEVAADRADQYDISSYLRERNLTTEDERVMAVELYKESFEPVVYAYVASVDLGDRSPDRGEWRQVPLDLTLDQFFDLFKRFSVVIQTRGANVLGKEYDESLD